MIFLATFLARDWLDVPLERSCMTREQFAEFIHWSTIIWVMGIVNMFSFLPQIVKVWKEHDAQGISVLSLVIIFCIQSAFSAHGFFCYNTVLLVSNGVAACTNLTLISLVLYHRRRVFTEG